MSFPRYPKYEGNGVEWLGDVPEHWEKWKLAHAFALIGSGTTPKTEKLNTTMAAKSRGSTPAI